MKKILKFTTLLLSLALLFTSISACSLFSSTGNTNPKEKTFTVEYYDNKTVNYTASSSAKSIQTDFIAPSGQYVKGLFDKNDIQYADSDCIVDLKNKTVPSILYAKYEPVDISYLAEDPFTAWEENPKTISFYSGSTLTWVFSPTEYPNDQKMISACLCNPYADLKITISFKGKGEGHGDEYQKFISQLIICDDVVASFEKYDLGSSNTYNNYSYTATIKAKLLTNSDYTIKVKTSSNLGYESYTIKNYRIDFDFDFNQNS